MTNHVIDLKNTDCALIIGSNAAENHPITMKWLYRARDERGAKIVHVDPRFTRTSSVADLWAPLRSGTDIAFIGGMINYIIENKLYHEEYVLNYTNASLLVKPEFTFEDGVYSGLNPEKGSYDFSTWNYQRDENNLPIRDNTLQDPHCVFQLLKKHYSRYDMDTVCAITGTPKAKYQQVIDMYCETGNPAKTGTIMYAMGTTQHTVGSQNVRSYAMLQLLLGNMGRPGGGVNALRGENNVQGSTDMAMLFGNLPGYLNAPTDALVYKDLAAYKAKETPASGFKKNTPKWITSTLKAWYGDAATPENDFGYHYLPKRKAGKNYSHIAMFEAMHAGELDGLIVWGGNPVVGGPNANKEQEALGKLKWLVMLDLWLHETAEFWTDEAWRRPVDNPDVPSPSAKDISTEVFFLPACGVYEKGGTAAQTGRWVQYRYKGAEPLGESRADLQMMWDMGTAVRKLYQGSSSPQDEPILNMTWGDIYDPEPDRYGKLDDPHHHEPDPTMVAYELNGFYTQDTEDGNTKGRVVTGFANLKDDGTTACGNWIYCGIMTHKEGQNDEVFGDLDYKAKWRKKDDPSGLGLFSSWGWCWPINRRILYNRCCVKPDGVTPWEGDDRVPLITWDGAKWSGPDIPDFYGTTAPGTPALGSAYGTGGNDPFIMRGEGLGCLFAPNGDINDGPFPEHYEPWESPLDNLLSPQQNNPVIKIWEPEKQGKREKFPIVCTTYRVVEHWQTGALTRNLPWLAELMPNMFVEVSEELALNKGIRNGSEVIISTSRGDVSAIACVTKRLKPFTIDGKTVHQVGTVWHYGHKGYATGDPANRLTPHVGDANTMIPEYKAFLCDIRRA